MRDHSISISKYPENWLSSEVFLQPLTMCFLLFFANWLWLPSKHRNNHQNSQLKLKDVESTNFKNLTTGSTNLPFFVPCSTGMTSAQYNLYHFKISMSDVFFWLFQVDVLLLLTFRLDPVRQEEIMAWYYSCVLSQSTRHYPR